MIAKQWIGQNGISIDLNEECAMANPDGGWLRIIKRPWMSWIDKIVRRKNVRVHHNGQNATK